MLETFTGSDLRTVFDDARRALGEDVLVLRTAIQRDGRRTRVELVAASAIAIQELRQRLDPPPLAFPRAAGGRGRSGPLVIGLVGPTGAGKTTTAAKLALHPRAFGGRKVGLMTLDTFRVGALEQMAQYAEVTDLPLEVVYDAREMPGALQRLDGCDVILVDTPGRSPRSKDANQQWQAMFRAAAPDEVHRVVPASMRPDLLPSLVASLDGCRITHACLTKLDELHDDRAVADLAARFPWPMRWVTTGQAVPDDLHSAKAAILSALGLPATGTRGTARGAAA
jgi:flagellar biosynthesis protein FlhF